MIFVPTTLGQEMYSNLNLVELILTMLLFMDLRLMCDHDQINEIINNIFTLFLYYYAIVKNNMQDNYHVTLLAGPNFFIDNFISFSFLFTRRDGFWSFFDLKLLLCFFFLCFNLNQWFLYKLALSFVLYVIILLF